MVPLFQTQAVAGLLEKATADAERAVGAALDARKLGQPGGGLLAGPAGRSAAVPAAKRQVPLRVPPLMSRVCQTAQHSAGSTASSCHHKSRASACWWMGVFMFPKAQLQWCTRYVPEDIWRGSRH